MKQSKQNTDSDFIIGSWTDTSDVNNPVKYNVAILKSDILRIWENDTNYKIFLKSKCAQDAQHYVFLNKSINIFEQL